MTTKPSPNTRKGTGTRTTIYAAAIELFQENGYEAATMRAIADRAGVSLGSFYYYFASKEHIVQEFYAEVHRRTNELAGPALARERRLDRRLHTVMDATITAVGPYHQFAGSLFRSVADPESPLNPFGAETRAVREDSIALFRSVVSGSSTRIPKDVAHDLPVVMWLYHMGVILFWVHDRSAGQRATRHLVDESVAIIIRLLALSQLPGAGGVRRRALALIRTLAPTTLPQDHGDE